MPCISSPSATLESEPPLEPLIASLLVFIGTPLLAGAVAFVLLLIVSAIVSGTEVALFSLDATKQEELAQRKDSASKRVLALLAKPQHVLITILLVNTMVNVSAAILAALGTEHLAEGLGLSREIVFLLEICALTFVLLVVSEITPKLIASRHAVAYSCLVAAPLRWAYVVLYPVIALLAAWIQRTQKGFYRWVLPEEPEKLSPADLKVMAEIGMAHGTIEEDEHVWINSILELGNTPVRAVMINRLDITALSVEASLPEALAVIRSSGHSRLPLYVGHLDNILGIVYAKDLLPYLTSDQDGTQVHWTQLMRPPMFVPLNKKLDALLQDFQKKKTHVAIVVDEYGGTAGLVALEDVLEEVVGDIQDEHDSTKESFVEHLHGNQYRVDARIDLDDLNKLLGLSLVTESFDFETLGGLIYNLAGDIPQKGYEVTYDRLHMTVDSVIDNRIGLVRVHGMDVEESTAS